MLNTIYRLTQPRKFEIVFEDIDFSGDKIIVKPTYLSICNADQRYYQGTRDAKVLAEKLPMALIHEGIGEVVYSPTDAFKVGDTVVMIPNIAPVSDDVIADNYLRTSKFCASSADGFTQEYVTITADRLVKLSDGIDKAVAAFTEFVSVSVHSITRFDNIAHKRRDIIGVWGDGNLSYITCIMLKKLFPETKIYVFGIVQEKLDTFSFCDATFLTTQIPDDLKIDHAFECVGGNASQIAINQIIDYINPEGTIAILGVSEYPVAINTRMILEKGLRVFGSSRSALADYVKTIKIYEQHPDIVEYLSHLVSTVKEVTNANELCASFDLDTAKAYGKTIMKWL